ANFVWLRLGERTMDFAAACAVEGVAVRPFAGEGARVSIGDPEANDAFLAAAAAFRSSETPPPPVPGSSPGVAVRSTRPGRRPPGSPGRPAVSAPSAARSG